MVKVFAVSIANSSQRIRINSCVCQSLDSEKTTFSINSQKNKVKTSYSSTMCEVIVSMILSASGTLLFIIPANTATNEFGHASRGRGGACSVRCVCGMCSADHAEISIDSNLIAC